MKFGILGNKYNTKVPAAIRDFIKFLSKEDIAFFIESDIALQIKKKFALQSANKLKQQNVKKINELIHSSDYIVSFGGDGTFLAAAKSVSASEKPIIGVNLGKLGFLAEINAGNINSFILDVLKKKYKTVERTVLEASFKNSKKKLYGLNEIVISKSVTGKTIEIEVQYNKQPVIRYLSDGLIVSTPTGSTGYSLSAGGPIMSPSCDTIVLSPICPHSLTARPIVLPDSGKLKIRVSSRASAVVTSDGNDTIKLSSNDFIQIKKANYKVKLLTSLDSNYFTILNQKLLLGQDVRQMTKHKEQKSKIINNKIKNFYLKWQE